MSKLGRERRDLEFFVLAPESNSGYYIGGAVLETAKVLFSELAAAGVNYENPDGSLNDSEIAHYVVQHRADVVDIVRKHKKATRAFEHYTTQHDSTRNENHVMLIATLIWLIGAEDSEQDEPAAA